MPARSRSRRRFLELAGASGLAWACAPALVAASRRRGFAADPFTLGVASGYPEPQGVVLWTRLAPEPTRGGGLGPEPIDVEWELAEDERFTKVVARGVERATAEWAHSVHVEVVGLQPARAYFYRFHAGQATSPVGRTRTAPARDAAAERLALGLASCQHYEQGYFAAYRHMAADNLDLIVHVGDYIYESSWGEHLVRRHAAAETITLDDYRDRYALYRTDRDLQAAHAACPWIVTWDDHEVENDYAGARSENLDPEAWFLARRAAAYKAYYEHMPLRRTSVPFGAHMRVYGRSQFGTLLGLHVLDDRQYRDAQACARPGRGGSTTVEECASLDDPTRSLLGATQEAWLADGLARTPTRWTVVAQQTLVAPLDRLPGPGRRTWTDGWDGYPAARRRLLDALVQAKAQNPIVLGGDVHSYWVADLKREPADARAPIVASEFVGTSITSQIDTTRAQADAVVAENPHVRFGAVERRGYLRLELSSERARADLRAVGDVRDPQTGVETLASFVVEAGRPGAQRA
jgi:alkaline phosphatase D